MEKEEALKDLPVNAEDQARKAWERIACPVVVLDFKRIHNNWDAIYPDGMFWTRENTPWPYIKRWVKPKPLGFPGMQYEMF